jgi:hypothetical protein
MIADISEEQAHAATLRSEDRAIDAPTCTEAASSERNPVSPNAGSQERPLRAGVV